MVLPHAPYISATPPPPPLPISRTPPPPFHSLPPRVQDRDRAQHGAEEPVRVGDERRRRRGSGARVGQVGARRRRGRRSGRRGAGGGAAADGAGRPREPSHLRRVQLLPQVKVGLWVGGIRGGSDLES
jgi:hypothetical protein